MCEPGATSAKLTRAVCRVKGVAVRLRPILPLIAALTLAACTANGTPRPGTETPAQTASPAPQAEGTSPSGALEGGELLRALRQGGFIIYFRHAATVPGSDSDVQDLSNCAAQRNLSEQGRQQSRDIGEAFRRLGIPVGAVRSSGFCRTLETANLAFGRAESSLDLTSLPQAGTPAEEERRVSALRALLATPPPPGQNTVLVAHLFNIQRAAGISIAEGEAAVFQPDGGAFRLVATVSPEEWSTLER